MTRPLQIYNMVLTGKYIINIIDIQEKNNVTTCDKNINTVNNSHH